MNTEIKKLNISKMETISGGAWTDIIDGACSGITTGALAGALRLVAFTGVGSAVVVSATAACLGWEIGKRL